MSQQNTQLFAVWYGILFILLSGLGLFAAIYAVTFFMNPPPLDDKRYIVVGSEEDADNDIRLALSSGHNLIPVDDFKSKHEKFVQLAVQRRHTLKNQLKQMEPVLNPSLDSSIRRGDGLNSPLNWDFGPEKDLSERQEPETKGLILNWNFGPTDKNKNKSKN